MIEFPPIPTWDGLHPLIVHFPIAVLLVAPIFVVLGAVLPRTGRFFSIAALLLMMIGTASTFLAIETGEAAGEFADRTPEVIKVLEHHEDLAEQTRTVFVALSTIFLVILILPRILARELGRGTSLALNGAFLLFYMAGAILLANTAHNGGRLVHELGVRAFVAVPADQVAPTTAAAISDEVAARSAVDPAD
jgi:uncharacterized membrane protein